MRIIDTINHEVTQYMLGTRQVKDGVPFSQYRLIRRIGIFQNRHLPKGKVTKQGHYRYWFDIIHPRINNEIKNLRFGSKNVLPFSVDPIGDFAAVFTIHAALDEYMWETGREEELVESIEQFSGEGNWLAKKIKGDYETCDFDNTFIINETARTVDETPIIHRAQLTQSQLRAKANVWNHVDDVIENCGNKFFKRTLLDASTMTTNPLYEIFERNGEISEKTLFEAQGKEGTGDENKYVLARTIVAGVGNNEKGQQYVLFAEPLTGKMSDWYVEAHRGPYKGRWWREGLYELLMDHQYRANEIGNQIARGLDWASRVIFKDDSPTIIQNIRTDMEDGDIIKSANLAQVSVRMQGLDQLIADYNRIVAEADAIANSSEVIQGQSMPAGTSFALGQLVDTNAGKLFVLLRGKIGHAYSKVFRDFVLPDLVKKLKMQDIIRVTGQSDFIDRFREIAVNSWYVDNLVNIGPHTPEMADALKQAKLKELQQTEPLIKNEKEIWDGVLQRIQVTITGENYDVSENLQTIAAVLQFETDPVRRAFLLDTIYAAKGIPVPPAVNTALAQAQPGATPQPEAQPTGGSPTNKTIKTIGKTNAAQPELEAA
jgi:hypothetical protein